MIAPIKMRLLGFDISTFLLFVGAFDPLINGGLPFQWQPVWSGSDP
jgi:hypothetical protein